MEPVFKDVVAVGTGIAKGANFLLQGKFVHSMRRIGN